MRRWLKKYFIPHRGNDHKPHFLRSPGRTFVLTVAFFFELLFVASLLVITRTNLLADILTSVLVEETNSDRVAAGVAPLKVNPLLVAAAKEKAEDMARKGYFAHVSPEGITPWYWLDKVGYKFSSAGENLAVNFYDSKDVADAWMNSPSHRQNVLSSKYTEIGIATARGTYDGRETVFVVQFFGNPEGVRPPNVPTKVSAKQPAQENYLSVKSAAAKEEIIPTTTPQKLSVKDLDVENLVASPRRTINIFYVILLGIVVLALLISILVEIKIQHGAPIVSGLLLIAILSAVVYVNHMVATIVNVF